MANKKEMGMGTVTITLNYCHKEEYEELKQYLQGKCWSVEFNNEFENGET